MGLESMTGSDVYITEFNAANPTAGDKKSEGDDHIRGVKQVLQNTLPKLSGQASMTHQELNKLAGLSATAAELNWGHGRTGYKLRVARSYTENAALVTGSTVIVLDDTIPQSSEGDEYLTLKHKPAATDNMLDVQADIALAHDSALFLMAALLFKDAESDAYAVACMTGETASAKHNVGLRRQITAGGVDTLTFKVRAGANVAGATTLNGQAGVHQFSTAGLSTLMITEYEP